MRNNIFKDPLSSPKIRLLVSFVTAVAIWTIVVTFFSTEARVVIEDVPINVDYNSNSYTSLGLEIIQQDIETIDVTVSGPRSVVGSLTKDDIIVYPQFANVHTTGKYELALNAIKVSAVMEFQIESISSYQMTASFDRVIEQTFDVDVDVSNITIASEYMVDKIYTTPQTVTIKGPENAVNMISKVIAVTQPQEINQSVVVPAEIELYDENGARLDESQFTFEQTEFTITIPVLKEITVPVKVEFINVPPGFDVSMLNMTLSNTEINIAVPSKDADSVTDFVIGYIDVKTLTFDSPYVFDVILPTGYKNMSEIGEITAVVSSENIVSKTVNVKEIKVINQGQHNIEVLTQNISEVEIVGQKDAVESLSDGAVIAQIDISKLSLVQGQQTVEVEILIPSSDKVYANGIYYATIVNE